MLEMVRQQMICIVTPGWRGGASLLQPGSSLRDALDDLLRDVKVVHFASIALLPPMTGTNDGPSLMLELAIEEGINPYDMVYRLVNHPSGTMWSLYGSYWPNGGPALESDRNTQLVDRLMPALSIADGGFVGTRDRTVRQVTDERKLLDWTRKEARNLRAAHGTDRASFALALAQRAFQNPDFDWALDPAPRSYWRGGGASIAAKVGYVLAYFVLWLVVVWLLGALPRWLTEAYIWLFGEPYAWVLAVTAAIGKVSSWILGVSLRAAIALLVLGFFAWLFLIALPALFSSWRHWLSSVRRELERPTDTWSSLSTYVAGWIIGVPLLLAVVVSALVYTFRPGYFVATVERLTPDIPGWQLIILGLVALMALIGIVDLISRINRRFSKWSEAFFHPLEDDVPRAQQVHRSIETSEAELVAGTAHMISLTDLRSPHGLSAWWIRAALRIVTLFGRVVFTNGRLGDAPGIHFGHWHIIEGGRRYLFCSNYDGNFGGYLDDFINGATIGTTLAWRWTTLKQRLAAAPGHPDVSQPRSFPPTRFAIFRGVKCELKFKSYARDSMLPHLYRFDACKTTTSEIDLATGLRDALFGERNDANDDLIMRAIET